MKLRKIDYLYIIFITILCIGWTYTYDTSTPAGTDAPSVIDDRIREVKQAIQERLNVEHVFDLTGTQVSGANTGKHTDITCTSVTSTGAISCTNVTGTGNTAITGTLDVTGNIDPTSFETTNGGFLDEDDMSSDSATGVASQQSIKAFAEGLGIRQVVSTRDTSTTSSATLIPVDDTKPYKTEGVQLFTLAITPNSATSTLIIEGAVLLSSNSANRIVTLALFQDTDSYATAVFCGECAVANTITTVPFYYKMTSNTTLETTFKLRAGLHSSGTVYYNKTAGVANIFGGAEGSTMIITEIGS